MPAVARPRRALLLALALAACGDDPTVPPPPPPPPPGNHAFAYVPPAGAPEVVSLSVRGTFNGWAERALQRQADGSWRTTLDLPPGSHEYKYFINGEWPTDMCEDRTWGDPRSDFWIDTGALGCVPDGHGGQNAVAVVGGAAALDFQHDPLEPADVSMAGGRLSIRFSAGRGAVQSAAVVTGTETAPMHLQLRRGVRDVWRVSLPAGTTTYRITLQTAAGAREMGPFEPPAAPFRDVSWVGEGIGYQVFPERFWNGDPSNDEWTLRTDVVNFMDPRHWSTRPVLMPQWGGEVLEFHCCHQYFGGDLQGIIDRLDHLEGLGVTLLYLNPIFTSGSAHGYDAFDYLEVAPNFGDEQTLRRLLEAARARGIRVMWDFVPNHVGVGHWAFQHAVTHGEASPYWSWFTFRVPGGQVEVGNGNHYDAWWGFGSLPRLETRNAAVLAHLMEVTRRWTEFGFDGIRVDVPNEIRNRDAFFRSFRQAAKAVDPEVYLVGEIWERAPGWLRGDGFDALMNYALGEGVIDRFARGEIGGGRAATEIAEIVASYPEASTAMQFNVISSHDTPRLLTRMGGGPLGASAGAAALARQRLASAMLHAFPGIPVTFQGDECAFLGTGEGPREENRYPMQWQSCDAQMLAHYTRIARLRRETEALRSPALRMHRGSGPVVSFLRGEPGPGEVLAAFNQAAGPESLPLPAGSWTDLSSGEVLSGSATLPAFGWRWLRRG
jgi:cyclomaltodextrinase / maltogenic alpha-amylase / neopullulanase